MNSSEKANNDKANLGKSAEAQARNDERKTEKAEPVTLTVGEKAKDDKANLGKSPNAHGKNDERKTEKADRIANREENDVSHDEKKSEEFENKNIFDSHFKNEDSAVKDVIHLKDLLKHNKKDELRDEDENAATDINVKTSKISGTKN